MKDPVAEPRPAGVEAAVGLAQAAQPGEQVGAVLGPAERHRVPMERVVEVEPLAEELTAGALDTGLVVRRLRRHAVDGRAAVDEAGVHVSQARRPTG